MARKLPSGGSAEVVDPEAYPEGLILLVEPITSPADRMLFIRKVYLLLCVQLAITTGIVATFLTVEPLQAFVKRHSWILFVTLIFVIILQIVLSCCSSVRRKYPINLVLLFIFNLLWGVLIGAIAASYSIHVLLIAAGSTLGIFLILTLLAFTCKCDFTRCWGFLLVFTLVFFVFSLLGFFLRSYIPYYHMILGGLGVALISCYILYDTQLMMDGKTHQISIDDYVFASLNLYIDVVMMFTYVLSCFQGS